MTEPHKVAAVPAIDGYSVAMREAAADSPAAVLLAIRGRRMGVLAHVALRHAPARALATQMLDAAGSPAEGDEDYRYDMFPSSRMSCRACGGGDFTLLPSRIIACASSECGRHYGRWAPTPTEQEER